MSDSFVESNLVAGEKNQNKIREVTLKVEIAKRRKQAKSVFDRGDLAFDFTVEAANDDYYGLEHDEPHNIYG